MAVALPTSEHKPPPQEANMKAAHFASGIALLFVSLTWAFSIFHHVATITA